MVAQLGHHLFDHIANRNDARELALLHDWHMTEFSGGHALHQIMQRVALGAGDDVARHHLSHWSLERLRAIGEEQGFEVVAVPLLPDGDAVDRISSTRIRNALAEGRMEDVAAFLGRPYAIRGPVLHGEERGRTMGFPTPRGRP